MKSPLLGRLWVESGEGGVPRHREIFLLTLCDIVDFE